MYITKVKIKNFKSFKDFTFEPHEGMNIIVGNSNEGKSTILEAIHLALTGFYKGKNIRNFFTQDIFNKEAVDDYIKRINQSKKVALPKLTIEVFFNDYAEVRGLNNSSAIEKDTISFSIMFDKNYSKEYEELLSEGNITTLPIEYYKVSWHSSANVDAEMSTRSINLKSVLIDTSEISFKSTHDCYITKIIKDKLEENEIIKFSQAYRNARDSFVSNDNVTRINEKLSNETHFMGNNIEMDIDMLNKNDWEKAIITKINSIPFENIGKGEQAIFKIELSLLNKKADKAGVILLEEPENHLTFSKLNRLLNDINENISDKQFFVTTHSSFVANKLGIDKIHLLENKNIVKISELSPDTQEFFRKKPGYDTLRFLLCKIAILVEGDADELIIQRAYHDKFNKLPIEDEKDVISVGNTFLRFLEIGDKIKKRMVVVTDNDGDINALKKKYNNYLLPEKSSYIKICYDSETHIGSGKLKNKNGGKFNYDTLEPCIYRANDLKVLNKIFGTRKKMLME